MAQKRPLSRCSSPSSEGEGLLFKSAPIEDRSSTFVAHFCPLASSSTASATGRIKKLQSHPDFKSASHRIVAWRKLSNQRTLGGQTVIYVTGSDDDGEKYAGKRLEKVLSEQDVAGTIVVARWYGGILLGPVRFTHIENVAKDAIAKWRASTDHGDAGQGDSKRRRVADSTPQMDEEEERVRLVKQLTERDHSICVLRELLAEKTQAGQADGPKEGQGQTENLGGSPSSPVSPTVTKIDYNTMPLQRLKQLEKARDATISWILKRIDAAEEQEKSQRQTLTEHEEREAE